jgi:two-component system OmpR family sensor kinase
VAQTMGYIKVTDNGPGISPAVARRIFDRFYQGDPSRSASGTGLGLAIVRAIAEALHGTAEVASSPQGGASIVVKIPLASAASRTGEAVGPPAPERSPQLH